MVSPSPPKVLVLKPRPRPRRTGRNHGERVCLSPEQLRYTASSKASAGMGDSIGQRQSIEESEVDWPRGVECPQRLFELIFRPTVHVVRYGGVVDATTGSLISRDSVDLIVRRQPEFCSKVDGQVV